MVNFNKNFVNKVNRQKQQKMLDSTLANIFDVFIYACLKNTLHRKKLGNAT